MALLYNQAGTIGFTMLLVPILSGQVFLVLLARRTNAHQQEVRDAEERERRRIARDLHDSVVQVVAGTAMTLSANSISGPRNRLPGTDWRGVMERSAGALRGAARDLRTLIIQIAPPTIHDDGLSAALQPLLAPLIETGVTVNLDIQEPPLEDKRDLELVFRVAQEALRNIVAHAHARTVTVHMSADATAPALIIEDDGKGFSPADVERRRRQGHVGTRGIAEVAAERGAVLSIDSTPGKGTRVILTLPKAKG